MLDKQHKPTALLLGHTEKIFAALNESAIPRHSGLLEPAKNAQFLKLVDDYLPPGSGDTTLFNGPTSALKKYYKHLGLPFINTTSGPALTRAGLLQWAVHNILEDPAFQYRLMSATVVVFELPMHFTRAQFPLKGNEMIAAQYTAREAEAAERQAVKDGIMTAMKTYGGHAVEAGCAYYGCQVS